MRHISVRSASPPQLRRRRAGSGLAKKALCRVLQQLPVGSITLYDGAETLHFGSDDKPREPHAEVQVHNPAMYRHIALNGALGSGESYMQGDWSSPDLAEVIRLFCANIPTLRAMDANASWSKKLLLWLAHSLNSNTLTRARKNIAAHYDLGNEFFRLFLDHSMMYSSAVFPHAGTSLEQAATHKLELICRQLQLEPTDHLLEIGTGWGGMAIHAAQHYGCSVTTTTISRKQYEHARARVAEAGLEQQITVLYEDYRKLRGRYDKLVSIEMIEAVGHQFYQAYFAQCSSLLKESGLMVLQAITIPDQRYAAARDSVDFIKRYIFPGGCLPSLEIISRQLAHYTDLQMVNLRDISEHYANTLACWRQRFCERLEDVRQQGFDETFERMWEFYLCYCEGGFRERAIGAIQLTCAKPAYRFA